MTMFDFELTSVIAIFAGIAALIAYISERAKRRIKTSGQPFKLKKMPSAQDSGDEQSSSLDKWYFPQPSEDSDPAHVQSKPTETRPQQNKSTHSTAQSRTSSIKHDPAQNDIAERAIRRTPYARYSAHSRFGTRTKLREAIVTMTVLGPCRGLAPYQEREHF